MFPSLRLHGKKPGTPDMILKNVIRPALERADITEKVIGWNSFFATRSRPTFVLLGVDLKAAQELLRHANSRITNRTSSSPKVSLTFSAKASIAGSEVASLWMTMALSPSSA